MSLATHPSAASRAVSPPEDLRRCLQGPVCGRAVKAELGDRGKQGLEQARLSLEVKGAGLNCSDTGASHVLPAFTGSQWGGPGRACTSLGIITWLVMFQYTRCHFNTLERWSAGLGKLTLFQYDLGPLMAAAKVGRVVQTIQQGWRFQLSGVWCCRPSGPLRGPGPWRTLTSRSLIPAWTMCLVTAASSCPST